jgi:hypothetical protein
MRILILIAILVLQGRTPLPIDVGVATGQLLSPNGTPAAGVRVTARAATESNNQPSDEDALVGFAQTDSDGRYRLERLPAGRYWISAGLVELPTYYPGGAVSVRAGATVENLNFTLARSSMTPKVSGRVVNAPNQNIQVVMIPTEDPGPIGAQALYAGVAADGAFEFSNVRPGVYWMTPLGDSPEGTQTWTVSVSDRDVKGIELTIPRRVGVAGAVTFEGAPQLPSVRISIAGENVALQPDGTFQAQVPEGEHRVTLRGLLPEYTVKSLTAGAVDLLRSPLKVSVETPSPRISVGLQIMSPVKVSGRLTGPDVATALQPTRLIFTNPTTGARIEVPVNNVGEFEFAKIAPGPYTASWTGLAPFPGPSVIVPEKDFLNLEVSMPPMKQVTIKTVIEGGGWTPTGWFTLNKYNAESPGAMFRLSSHQDERSLQTILPLGEFSVELAPLHSTYGATARLKSVVYGSSDLLSGPFKISQSDSEEIRFTYGTGVVKPWVKVSGRVIGLDALTQRNATVVLRSSGIVPIETSVNADGTFEFLMVPRGVYTATLPSSSGASVGRLIDVRNQDLRDVEITVPR